MKVFQREKKFEILALAAAIILMVGCGRAPIGDPSVDTDQIETLRKEAASLKTGPRAQTKTFHAMNKLYAAIAGILLTSGLQPPAHGKEAEKNPYLAIVERNAFDLTDTPPNTQQKAPEPLKASDIKLTGIFLRNGVERAAIALIEKDKKKYEAHLPPIGSWGKAGGPLKSRQSTNAQAV